MRKLTFFNIPIRKVNEYKRKNVLKNSVVAHTPVMPALVRQRAGRSLQTQSQPGLHSSWRDNSWRDCPTKQKTVTVQNPIWGLRQGSVSKSACGGSQAGKRFLNVVH